MCNICNLEVMPMKYRGKAQVSLNYFTSIGRILAASLATILIPGKAHDEWRRYMLFSTFLSALVPLCIYFFTYESPRFLISKYKYDEAFEIIEKMDKMNNGISMPLTDTEKEIIILQNKKTIK